MSPCLNLLSIANGQKRYRYMGTQFVSLKPIDIEIPAGPVLLTKGLKDVGSKTLKIRPDTARPGQA